MADGVQTIFEMHFLNRNYFVSLYFVHRSMIGDELSLDSTMDQVHWRTGAWPGLMSQCVQELLSVPFVHILYDQLSGNQ